MKRALGVCRGYKEKNPQSIVVPGMTIMLVLVQTPAIPGKPGCPK